MNSVIHLTDFSLQKEIKCDTGDNPKYGLNGWRLYNQHQHVQIMQDPDKEGYDSVLRFISATSVRLRPGIIIYRVISGFPLGYKLEFSMTARRRNAYNEPLLSIHYDSTILKTEFPLTNDYEKYLVEFTVCDDVTIIAIENSITESAGNDFYISELKIQPAVGKKPT